MTDELEWDILFLALSRPTMKMGVPAEGLMINVLLTSMAYLWFGHGQIWWMLGSLIVFPMIHLPMRILTALDHNIFREIRLWAETSGVQLNIREWGGQILCAVPHGLPKQIRDLSGSV